MDHIKHIIVAFSAVLLWSCTGDKTVSVGPSGEEIEVTLGLSLPGMSMPQTRSMTNADESHIDQLDVLVFLEWSGNYTFSYRTWGVVSNNSTPGDTRFTVNFRKSSSGEKYRIVFIANMRDKLNSVLDDMEGLSQEEALKLLTFEAGTVYSNSLGAVRYLPMWGEFPQSLEMTETLAGTNIGTVNMLRSLARVDVGVNFNNNLVAQGVGNKFYIKAVSLVNGQKKGQVVPYEANFNASGGTGGKGIVTAPSLPASPELADPVKVEHYPADWEFVRELYVPEAVNSATDPISVMIEGIYIPEGGQPADGTITYYRVELIKDNDRSTAHDLLRNHRYMINILNCYGPGYDTWETAMKEPPQNLITDLWVMDDENINYIIYNQSYMLGVDSLSQKWDGNWSMEKEVLILTNHPDGWTAKLSSSATNPDAPIEPNAMGVRWVHINDNMSGVFETSGVADQVCAVNFLNMSYTGLQDESRTAYLHIFAGPFTLVVTLEQKNWYINMHSDLPDRTPLHGQRDTVKLWSTTADFRLPNPRPPVYVYGTGMYMRPQQSDMIEMTYDAATQTYTGRVTSGNNYTIDYYDVTVGFYLGILNPSYVTVDSGIKGLGNYLRRVPWSEGNGDQQGEFKDLMWAINDHPQSPMNWPQAMGLPNTNEYLTQSFNQKYSGHPYFKQMNLYYPHYTNLANANTGCASYFEFEEDKGKWFLPYGYFIRDNYPGNADPVVGSMKELYYFAFADSNSNAERINVERIGMVAAEYWTSNEYRGSGYDQFAEYVLVNGVNSSTANKASQYRVRCVRFWDAAID